MDFVKALDEVHRIKIWEIYNDNVNRVTSEKLKCVRITEGMRQGQVMNPLLFIIFMDTIIKHCNGKIDKKCT